MSRELNRELFGELNAPASRPSSRTQGTSEGARPAIATTEDLKVVSFQIDSMARKLKEFESKIEVLSSKWEEYSSSCKLRFERIQGNFQRQSESMQSSFRDVHAKIATVASRVNERKMTDASIIDMVEGNQRAVQSLEVRVQQLQKTIGEQELELLNSRSELRDLMKELTKIKRP